MDCTHQLPLSRILEAVIGIQYGANSRPAAVLWQCPRCKSCRAVLWEKASDTLKARARQVEIERAQIAGAV